MFKGKINSSYYIFWSKTTRLPYHEKAEGILISQVVNNIFNQLSIKSYASSVTKLFDTLDHTLNCSKECERKDEMS
jgi:hypothetical protein